MTSAWLQGKRTKLQGQEKYVCRIQETGRTRRRHSNFWILEGASQFGNEYKY